MWTKIERGTETPPFEIGTPYLMAVPVRRIQKDLPEPKLVWEVNVAYMDEDGSLYIDDDPWGWEWSDVVYYQNLERLPPLVYYDAN